MVDGGLGSTGRAERARRRLAVVLALALAASGAVVLRLAQVSVLDHEAWAAEGQRQQQRTVVLAPERGAFLDRDGRELAVSVPAWSAWADPSLMKEPGERARAARRLAPVLGQPAASIRQRLEGSRWFAWLERKLERDDMEAVAALGLRGVGFVKESRRVRPQGELAADVLGITGTDGNGLEGLEYRLEPEIGGKPGRMLTLRDARGDHFLPAGLSCQLPERGADVVLTLHSGIQHVAERELRAAVARTGAASGALIVLFPGNGEVAALTSHPTPYSSDSPTDPSHLRVNRAVASCYEPGSTFKMFTVAAAIEARLARPDDVIDCGNGSLLVGRTRIRDHRPFGNLTVAQVLEESSNVGAMKIGLGLGAARLHAAAARFGFGRPSGVGLPGESAGILRDPRAWTPASVATISFGQELAVTPIQLAAAASALATDGLVRPPRLLREIRRADGTVVVPPSPRPRRAVSAATARTVSGLLEGVVLRGTGKLAAVPGYRVAGKTGTAQVVGADGAYRDDAHVASFVGWAPARDPAILVLVVLDHPKGASYHGGDVAAPVFAAVARDALRLLRVPPDDGPGALPPDEEVRAAAENERAGHAS